MTIDSLFSTNVVCFAFITGVCVSVLFYEKLHLTTGSAVVPAYIALYALYPWCLAVTFANALLIYAVVHRVLPRFVLISGPGKFAGAVVGSVLLDALTTQLFSQVEVGLPLGIGYVMPGLIAHDMGRHGAAKTLKSVTAAGALVGLVVVTIALSFDGLGGGGRDAFGLRVAFDPRWLPLTALLSVAAAFCLRTHRGMRTGGFIGGAYISLLLAEPSRLLLFASLSFATYATVNYVLKPRMILFGRRKFAATLLVGTLYAWLGILVNAEVRGAGAAALAGSLVALIEVMLTGLVANDVERVGVRRVVCGAGLSASFCLAATLLADEVLRGQRLEIMLPAAVFVATSGTIIFGTAVKQLFERGVKATAGPALVRRTAPSGTSVQVSPAFAMAGVAVLALCLATYVGILPLMSEVPSVFGSP